MVAGAAELRSKLTPLRPRMVCFNGKGIYEVFSGKPCEVGLQEAKFPGECGITCVVWLFL